MPLLVNLAALAAICFVLFLIFFIMSTSISKEIQMTDEEVDRHEKIVYIVGGTLVFLTLAFGCAAYILH